MIVAPILLRVATCVGTLLTLGATTHLSHVGASSSAGGSSPSAAPPPPQHLYLTSPSGGAVYSFPLTNGIPSKTPNAVITGLSYPLGVAVDEAGYLYVSDAGASVLDVFAPGANGPAKPVRQMQVDLRYMVAWRDFLIAQNQYDGIGVYSADGNGPTPKFGIEEIPFPSYDMGLAVRPNGKLYLTWGSKGQLTVYDNVLPPPGRTAFWFSPSQLATLNPFHLFGGGLAVDDREIFAELLSGGPIRIVVLPVNSNGPTKPRRIMVTGACNGGPSTLSYSLAIFAGYLYEACTSANSVFIFNKNSSGHISPLFTLSGPFVDVFWIALGP